MLSEKKLKKAIWDNLKELGLSQQEEWMWWDMWQPQMPQQWASDVWQTIQTNPEQKHSWSSFYRIFLIKFLNYKI